MEVIETDRDGEDNNNILDDKRNKGNAEAENEMFDVAIIGGGFAGLSAALLLGGTLDQPLYLMSRNIKRAKYMAI